MKKFKKTFGERPEEVVVLRTKVFFDAEGIAEVEDEDVIAVLEAIPGYELVNEGEREGTDEKTPVEPASEPTEPPSKEEEPVEPADENPAEEPTSEEDESDEEDESEEDAPKPVKAPRAPRRPTAPKK